MNVYDTTEVEGTELDDRTERALAECMTVLPEGGDVYTVVGENQNGEYRVDAREGRCTCPDHKHRDVTCKHQRRFAFATGQHPIPAGVETVDPLLGEHVDGEPVATDDVADQESPREECWCADSDLPCFKHFQAGRTDD